MSSQLSELRRTILANRERDDARLRAEVARARARGASWSEIGRALGVSKQAAQHRFGGRE